MTSPAQGWGSGPDPPGAQEAAGSRKGYDIFPLPAVATLPTEWGSKRVQARVVRSVNDTIRALNWLAGAEHRGESIMLEKATRDKANLLQSDVLSRVSQLCAERELERADINPKDAYVELLRGRGL